MSLYFGFQVICILTIIYCLVDLCLVDLLETRKSRRKGK